MSLKAKFLALFGSKPETAPSDEAVEAFLSELTAGVKPEGAKQEGQGTAAAAATTTPAPAAFADSPEAKAMQTKIEKLERDNKVAAIKADAATFADAEIKAERSLPTERDTLIADFTEAAIDDLESPRKVTFSAADGKAAQGSRVDRLKARCAARPRTILTRDFLSSADLPEGATVVFAASNPVDDKDKKPSKDRLKSLLSKTYVGKAALKKMDDK